MRQYVTTVILIALIGASSGLARTGLIEDGEAKKHSKEKHNERVQLGPRPFFLVNDLARSQLKDTLLSCSDGPFEKTDFSIGHRGAGLAPVKPFETVTER